ERTTEDGAVLSTVSVTEGAGVSMFPAASMARTRTGNSPSLGRVQALEKEAPPGAVVQVTPSSVESSTRATPELLPSSADRSAAVPEKVKVVPWIAAGADGVTRLLDGGVLSTTTVTGVPEASTPPRTSWARERSR